jgi:hypothetical protein
MMKVLAQDIHGIARSLIQDADNDDNDWGADSDDEDLPSPSNVVATKTGCLLLRWQTDNYTSATLSLSLQQIILSTGGEPVKIYDLLDPGLKGGQKGHSQSY